jgi:hypothetical protein
VTPASPAAPAQAAGLPIGRTILAALLLRRFGLLPLVVLALAGRELPPARRRMVLTVAAAIYLGAFALLFLLLLALVGGLAFVVLWAT